MLTTRPRGTNDILPGQVEKWQYLEKMLRKICDEYGYGEIRTPIFEDTKLFLRGVGETTDIVEKEMYSFDDRGGRNITLRPEGTASTVRAFLEHKLYADPQPTKMFYIGPMFRYDRPQAGRYRQFNQFGIEAFGSNHPSIDAEVITMACDILERLGLKNLDVHINTVGCPKCRAQHKEELLKYFETRKDKLCKTCQARLLKNPLRILDCKSEVCQELSKDAPTTLSSACPECKEHFEEVKDYLDRVNVNYTIDPKLVRGLDYYTNTAFEIINKGIGAQSAICGGGRYNGLIEQCGGKEMPGIGFAMGIERLLITLEQENITVPIDKDIDVYFVPLGKDAQKIAFELTASLRKKGLKVEKDYLEKSLKAQMKTANRLMAKYTVIIGEEELNKGYAIIRNMSTSEQEEVAITEVVKYFEGRFF